MVWLLGLPSGSAVAPLWHGGTVAALTLWAFSSSADALWLHCGITEASRWYRCGNAVATRWQRIIATALRWHPEGNAVATLWRCSVAIVMLDSARLPVSIELCGPSKAAAGQMSELMLRGFNYILLWFP